MDVDEPQTGIRPRREGRSPSYPGIDLEKALVRARELFDRDGRNASHIDQILRHWGYSPKSGPGRITFSALKKFGLLAEEGTGPKRRGRLSDLALRILLDERPDSPERRRAIQQAALNPSIHRELWEEYEGSLPSDETLRSTLRIERRFTESGASEFIQEFKDTIAFAGLDRGSIPPDQEESTPNMGGTVNQFGASVGKPGSLYPAGTGGQAPPVNVPLGGGRWATLQVPTPFSERDWERLLGALNGIKPGLIDEGEPSPRTEESEAAPQEEPEQE
jgi:hypothetical protein